jgi:hypothetical protein
MAFMCIGFALLGLLWLIGAFVLRVTGIHETEITDTHITLDRVSDAFYEALRSQRLAEPYRMTDPYRWQYEAMMPPQRSSVPWLLIGLVLLILISLIGAGVVAVVMVAGLAKPPLTQVVEPSENFRLKAPGAGWELLSRAETQKLNPLASAAAKRDFENYMALVIVETAEENTVIDGNEKVVGRAIIQDSNATQKQTESIEAVNFKGVKAVRCRFTGVVNGQHCLIDNTVFIYHGKIYQLFCAGPVGTPKQTFQPVLDAFELLP